MKCFLFPGEGGQVQLKRAERSYVLCERVRIMSLGFKAGRSIIQVAVLPQWRYSMHARPETVHRILYRSIGIFRRNLKRYSPPLEPSSWCLFYIPGWGLGPQENCARVLREWGCRTREQKGQRAKTSQATKSLLRERIL